MFASQLLRILQTIPSDVKYETCVTSEQDMTMKENQNATVYDPYFGSKEIYPLNGLRRDTLPIMFDEKERVDECWNPKFVDDFSMDKQNGTRISTEKEFQNGLFYPPSSLKEDTDSLSSDTSTKDKLSSCPDHERSMTVEKVTSFNENELKGSRSPYVAASDYFETDTNFYTDKDVLEYDRPELMVCYKDINYHVVKDICVDEGLRVNSKILIGSRKDEPSSHSFRQPLDDDSRCEATEGDVDMETFIANALTTSTLEYMKGVKVDELERPNSQSGSSFDKDSVKDQEELMQKSETNSVVTDETVSDCSADDSFIYKTLPIQDYGTRSFLRSFINSFDDEGNKAAHLPDQKISSGKTVSQGPTESSTEAGPNEVIQSNSLRYNSKVETKSITFNFNSMAPNTAGVAEGKTENVKEEPSVDSTDVLDPKNEDSLSPLDSSQVHCNSRRTTSIGEIHEESLDVKDGFSNDFSAASQSECVSSNGNDGDQLSECKDDIAHDVSSDGGLTSRKSVDDINSDIQAVELEVLKVNDSAVSQEKYEPGESSFSAASFVAHSEPVAFSGSISFRSDGSATSGRSFAFPILQSEWNSSPVRMTKADETHFRKHKCWRSGLLCCRF